MSVKRSPSPGRSGGGAGLRCEQRNTSRLPIEPASRAALTACQSGSKRRWKPICRRTWHPFAAATASAHESTSRPSGFSQKTCFPAAAAPLTSSGWLALGVAMTTPATTGAASSSSAEVDQGTPYRVPSSRAIDSTASATPASRAPATRVARACACRRPMRPRPTTATGVPLPVRIRALVAVRIQLDRVAERVLAVAGPVGRVREDVPDARDAAAAGRGDAPGCPVEVGRHDAEVEDAGPPVLPLGEFEQLERHAVRARQVRLPERAAAEDVGRHPPGVPLVRRYVDG